MVGFHRRVEDQAETTQSEGLISADRLTVVDADGLNWLAKHPDWFERVPERSLVLTPHAGEMSRLLDRPSSEITADPARIAAEAAARWRQVVVLKAGTTVASDGDESVSAGPVPASLATAGSGDVFSGFIAGLIAQGVKPLDAAAIAMYAGSAAARLIERQFGKRGLVASDLPNAMAEAIAALEA
jgi:NAD(P)H-hydrate epimerase